VWNPAKQALACEYCGLVSEARVEAAGDGRGPVEGPAPEHLREFDLAEALRALPDDARGWKREATQVKCSSCQAISVFEAARVSQNCEFCGSSALVPYQEVKETIRPLSLLPFKVAEGAVRERIREWYASRWFAPNALGEKARTDTVRGLYIPYWTFDAKVDASWTAESGTYYYTTRTVRDAQGRTRTEQVRHVRWSPASGRLEHFFDDALVCASKGVHPVLLRKIEPFDTKALVPYDPAFLSGWVVERYQIDLLSASKTSRDEMQRRVEEMCAAQVPGDTHRNLQVDARYSGRTFKHILVPVWMLQYHFNGKPFQVVVNGVDGKIAGEQPYSWIKIALAVVGVIVAIAVIASIAN
jgi:hypothetical protein